MNAHTTEQEKEFIQNITELISQDPSYELMPSDKLYLGDLLTELTINDENKCSIYLGIVFALETYLKK